MLWKYLGPHIWNSLLNQISKEIDYTKFEEFVNDWFDMKCKQVYLKSLLNLVQKCQFNTTNATSDLVFGFQLDKIFVFGAILLSLFVINELYI